MGDKPIITKVVIKIGDTEHSMTLEQAKALRDALTSAFPEPSQIQHVPYIPVPPWWQSYWTSSGTAAETNKYGLEYRFEAKG